MEFDNLNIFRKVFIASGSWYEGEDADPYALVFVVRDRVVLENGDIVSPSEKQAVCCAMRAMMEVFSAYDDERVRIRIDEWLNARIRKIVKRAYGSKWNKVVRLMEECEIPGVLVENDTSAVLCFAPMKASEQPKAIKRLQVSGLNLDEKDCIDKEKSLHVCLEKSLDMSSGKAIAQCGHAVQLAFKYLSDEDYNEWKENDFEVSFERGDVTHVLNVRKCPVIVKDAGFTEIPAGSVTAVAYFQ